MPAATLLVLLSFLSCVTPVRAAATAPARPDVLFIAVDDLNDGITLLDSSAPIAPPNLQRLARRGVSFTRAYAVTLPRAFMQAGYRVEGAGKIFHHHLAGAPLLCSAIPPRSGIAPPS